MSVAVVSYKKAWPSFSILRYFFYEKLDSFAVFIRYIHELQGKDGNNAAVLGGFDMAVSYDSDQGYRFDGMYRSKAEAYPFVYFKSAFHRSNFCSGI